MYVYILYIPGVDPRLACTTDHRAVGHQAVEVPEAVSGRDEVGGGGEGGHIEGAPRVTLAVGWIDLELFKDFLKHTVYFAVVRVYF